MSGFEIPLMFIAAATSVAGGVMGYQAGQYEQDVAEQNSVAAAREGTVASQIENTRSRQALGRGRMLASSSGLQVEGSATDVLAGMAAAGNFSAREAIYLGRRRMMQARADGVSARMRGTASLLQGVGQAGTILTSINAPPGGGTTPKVKVKGGV